MPERTRHIIGCMTGTSLDGLDAVLVRVTGKGLAMRAEFVRMVSHPLGDLAETLRSFASGVAHPPIDYLRAARRLGELHAAACAELVEHHAGEPERAASPQPLNGGGIDFVLAHGQTIWHAPRDERGHLSWQLFDPWPIVRRLGVPVCYDLRQADLIAGGEGAPITPIADWVMYRSPRRSRMIVNLGGICNATELPLDGEPQHVRGSDIGPCNMLLDGLVRRLYPDHRFDPDGAFAATGAIRSGLASFLLDLILHRRRHARSLGREVYNEEFLDEFLSRTTGLMPQDILATAVHAIAPMIAGMAAGTDPRTEIVLAGGGSRNRTLVTAIRDRLRPQGTLITTDELGIPYDAREAMAFAVLGALSQDGVAITLPQVTGSERPGRAGAWAYP